MVAFADGNEGAARAAIRRAGGTIVDVNEAANLALVSASGTAVRKIRNADAVVAVVRNHAVGTTRPGMPHRFAQERPTARMRARFDDSRAAENRGQGNGRRAEPLAALQWDMDMIGATPDGAHRQATGRGVTVGIIDTGLDASHPDIAPNFGRRLSRNFTMDIPLIDGQCEVPTCIDPPDVDDGGHGTHVGGHRRGRPQPARHLRRRAERHVGEPPRRTGRRLVLRVRDGRRAHLRRGRRDRRRQHELLHRPVAVQLRVPSPTTSAEASRRRGDRGAGVHPLDGPGRPRLRPRARGDDGCRGRQQPLQPGPPDASGHHQPRLPAGSRATTGLSRTTASICRPRART